MSQDRKTIADLFRRGPTDIYSLARNPRFYDWDMENVRTFWKNTLAIGKYDLMMGIIITSESEDRDLTERMRNFKDHNDVNVILVWDGQQRLTTLVILLCALRDYLIHPMHNSSDLNVRGCAAYAYHDLQTSLAPPLLGHYEERVERIWQSEWSGDFLSQKILMKSAKPPNKKPKVVPNGPDAKMKDAYDFFTTQIVGTKVKDVLAFYDKLKEKIKFSEVRFKNPDDALALVLSAHKSKNIAPVDSFKHHLLNTSLPEGGGTIARPSNPVEAKEGQHLLQQEFIELCEAIGRDVVEDAFTMMAQFELGEDVNSNLDGNSAVALFERYIGMMTRHGNTCITIFRRLSTMAKKWHRLNNGKALFQDSDDEWEVKIWGSITALEEKIRPSVDFATGCANTHKAKQRKVAASILQSVWFTLMIPVIHQPHLTKDIPFTLKNLEGIFLWALFAACPQERQERFAVIRDDIKRYKKVCGQEWAEILSPDEHREIIEALEVQSFRSYRAEAKVLLVHLNALYTLRPNEIVKTDANIYDDDTTDPDGNNASLVVDHSFVETMPNLEEKHELFLWDLVVSPRSSKPRGESGKAKKSRLEKSEFPLTKCMAQKSRQRKKLLMQELTKMIGRHGDCVKVEALSTGTEAGEEEDTDLAKEFVPFFSG